MQSVYEKIVNMDPRILYATMMILVVSAYLVPIHFPIVVHEQAQMLHDYIEKTPFPPRAYVVFEVDVEMNSVATLRPGGVAILNHLLMKDFRIVFTTLHVDGVMVTYMILARADKDLLAKKMYDQDYVMFGYIPGLESGLSAFVSDIHKAVPTDIRGTPIEQIPMMKEIHTAKDVAFTVMVSSQANWLEFDVRQWGTTSGVPLLAVTNPGNLPAVLPYFPRFIKAYSSNINEYAEYEKLIGVSGEATRLMTLVSIPLILLLGFIALGNMAYLMMKAEEKRKEQK